MSAREDFPYCVSCGEKVSVVSPQGDLTLYYCACGEVVEVKYYEKLLCDSRSS